jgi:copper(I)-binding protein
VDARAARAYIGVMHINLTRRTVCLIACVFLMSAVSAAAEDFHVGTIEIANPWMRATPKNSPVAGAFMTIRNTGTAPDRLLGGSSPVAAQFEVHSMVMDGGVAKMRPVEGGLELKPGDTVELKPGGFHVMMMGLKQQLEKGQKIKATLEFEKAGKVEVEYTVEGIGATSPASHMHGH